MGKAYLINLSIAHTATKWLYANKNGSIFFLFDKFKFHSLKMANHIFICRTIMFFPKLGHCCCAHARKLTNKTKQMHSLSTTCRQLGHWYCCCWIHYHECKQCWLVNQLLLLGLLMWLHHIRRLNKAHGRLQGRCSTLNRSVTHEKSVRALRVWFSNNCKAPRVINNTKWHSTLCSFVLRLFSRLPMRADCRAPSTICFLSSSHVHTNATLAHNEHGAYSLTQTHTHTTQEHTYSYICGDATHFE